MNLDRDCAAAITKVREVGNILAASIGAGGAARYHERADLLEKLRTAMNDPALPDKYLPPIHLAFRICCADIGVV